MSQQTILARRIALDKVAEAPWNVNVMDVVTFQALLHDMGLAGPEGTDPIDTCSARVWDATASEDQRVTADGAHRVRAAKQLGWLYLYEIYHPEITTQEDARLFNYRRDADRGSIDPVKLAESFKWFMEVKGRTQEQIAKQFGVDRSTVSKKLGLLNLHPDVGAYALKHGLTVSHLEPVSTLPAELQATVIKDVVEDAGYGYGNTEAVATVKTVERKVAEAKKQLAALDKHKKLLAESKFPKCPTCGADPAFDGYAGELPWVGCSSRQYDHKWNLQTGKGYRSLQAEQRAGQGPTFNPRTGDNSPSLPQHVKMARDPEDFEKASWAFLQNLWPRIALVDHCHWNGIQGKLKNGERFQLSYNPGDFRFETKGEQVYFSYAEVGKTTDAYKEGMRTRFTGPGFIKKESQLKTWEDLANGFLAEYGPAPRGTKKEAKK